MCTWPGSKEAQKEHTSALYKERLVQEYDLTEDQVQTNGVFVVCLLFGET